MSKSTGQFYEQQALVFLQQQGLQLLQQNYSCRFGEIDLVMREQQCLVFVEVKFRRSNSFGGAAAAVTQAKQQKLTRAASFYLQQAGQQHCRFDVVAITEQPADICWIKNAFAGTAN
ncbi:YraN family protein [Rheinheimera sediminis]|uniref:YraN family protein n=1 Tax=Rheinheimera sp. YQF-1 TaxID=2499626 RepID=UPI000FD703A4|nr:YraN family protein [Rheinheimera sp. YQF-1]RVT45766.1 YraN family protein [Rheinheimera sp. YQF-1]